MTNPNPNAEIYQGIQNVEVDDCVTGLVKWLKTKESLMDLLGHYVDIAPFDRPFIFPHLSFISVHGKQTNSLIVRNGGSWSEKNDDSSLLFIKIILQFWCDPLRDDKGNISYLDEAYNRLTYIYSQFDKIMHRPGALKGSDSTIEMWGTIRSISCKRFAELVITPATADEPLMGEASYGVVVG